MKKKKHELELLETKLVSYLEQFRYLDEKEYEFYRNLFEYCQLLRKDKGMSKSMAVKEIAILMNHSIRTIEAYLQCMKIEPEVMSMWESGEYGLDYTKAKLLTQLKRGQAKLWHILCDSDFSTTDDLDVALKALLDEKLSLNELEEFIDNGSFKYLRQGQELKVRIRYLTRDLENFIKYGHNDLPPKLKTEFNESFTELRSIVLRVIEEPENYLSEALIPENFEEILAQFKN